MAKKKSTKKPATDKPTKPAKDTKQTRVQVSHPQAGSQIFKVPYPPSRKLLCEMFAKHFKVDLKELMPALRMRVLDPSPRRDGNN